MKNIHVLPTDKPSRLFLNRLNNKILLEDIVNPSLKKVLPSGSYQNIYITSDEEIKVGNYYLCYFSMKPLKCIGDEYFNNVNEKKIILTTDQDLIKNGVQAIDDEFLEWFVKNPSCEEVKIIYGLFNTMGRQVDPMNLGQNHSQCVWIYKIIIPKEEPKQDLPIVNGSYGCIIQTKKQESKQETLEKTAVEWLESQLTDYLKRIYKQEIEEAKEMEKQQIIDANRGGVDMVIDNAPFITGEQYYNETFNK